MGGQMGDSYSIARKDQVSRYTIPRDSSDVYIGECSDGKQYWDMYHRPLDNTFYGIDFHPKAPILHSLVPIPRPIDYSGWADLSRKLMDRWLKISSISDKDEPRRRSRFESIKLE